MRLDYRNRCSAVFMILVACTSAIVLAQDQSPAGRWKTIDDRTGKPKSIVQIVEANGELQGTVAAVLPAPGIPPNPKCLKCSGDRKDKPIVGMTIMWGLKKDHDEYSGGSVFDPDNGKTYRCKVKVVNGGRKLEVRGFIGFSMIGRTQTWVREAS
jgi:uncharacterized protein (DUF2147 family)